MAYFPGKKGGGITFIISIWPKNSSGPPRLLGDYHPVKLEKDQQIGAKKDRARTLTRESKCLLLYAATTLKKGPRYLRARVDVKAILQLQINDSGFGVLTSGSKKTLGVLFYNAIESTISTFTSVCPFEHTSTHLY